jgi:sec-independent protein translocase protein TatA
MISTPVFAIIGIPGLGTPELLIILAVVLILFGPKRLPALGKSIGKTFKSLKDGIDGKLDDGEEDASTDASAKKAEPSTADAKKSADKQAADDSDEV